MPHVPSVDQVAEVLARAPPWQPWRLEGPTRNLIRSYLCGHGWRWRKADRRAFLLVAHARNRNGVRVPAGWDADTDLASWVGTIECAVCDRVFVPRVANHIYCGRRCRDFAATARIAASRPRHTRCANCADILVDPGPLQKFCSAKCQLSAERKRKRLAGTYREAEKWRDYRNAYKRAQRRADLKPRLCLECGAPIDPDANLARKVCSPKCAEARERRLQRERRKLNGHANGHDHHAPDRRPAADPGPLHAGVAGGDRRDPDELPRGHAGAPGSAALGGPARGAPTVR